VVSGEQRAQVEAEALAQRVFFHDLLHRLRKEPNELLPFHAVAALRPRGEHYLGVRPIEVDRIIGSVDRYEDFDHHFLPKEPHTIQRWAHLRSVQLKGAELPPIQVYQVGDVYFVKDGNHRVALAKAEQQRYIDAEIIALDVPIPPQPGDTLKDLIIKGEYAHFLEVTRLPELRPGHLEIRFTVPGRYDILLDHIHTHQYYMGLELKRSILWEEAVTDWYDRLYVPTVQQIRDRGILKSFPGRTEADLYLWIMDHRYYLSKALGEDVGAEEAARSYQEHFHKGPLERLFEALMEWWQQRRRLRGA
jgi:hypothetical protein